jgi:hypothetical protein
MAGSKLLAVRIVAIGVVYSARRLLVSPSTSPDYLVKTYQPNVMVD